MAEAASDKHIASIPRFTLPPEFSNDKPPAAPPPAAAPETPPIPAEAPKEPESAAPTADATPPEPPKETEVEPGKETTEKVPARLQKRIDRATRLRYEAEARAAQLEREAAELRTRQTQTADPEEPKMSDYTDISEYGKAMREYGAKKTSKEAEVKQREEQGRKFQQDVTNKWAAQAAKGEVEYDDFEEVVGDLKPTSPWAVAIMQEENGYKVAHYLGKHPKEAETIIGLNPYAQIQAISRLAIKLQAPAPAPQKPSKAPPPIAPVTGTAEAKKDEIKPNQPFEEYRSIGNKLFRGR